MYINLIQCRYYCCVGVGGELGEPLGECEIWVNAHPHVPIIFTKNRSAIGCQKKVKA